MSNDPVFRVLFSQEDKIYEVYAKEIDEEAMLGFICIGELVFAEPGSVVVDPSEEKLKAEFNGVKRIYVPLHTVIRIDEMDHFGIGKIKDSKSQSNVRAFPTMPTVLHKDRDV